MDSIFLKACKRQPVEYTPVWLMRQVGRYLPQYRKIRNKYGFGMMYKTPSIASELTVAAVETLDVDAAIIFSDLLVVPEAVGCPVTYTKEDGPVLEKCISNDADVEKLRNEECVYEIDYVYEAIKMTKKMLPSDVPLIGFAGAPWTMAAYMIDGHHNSGFRKVCSLIKGSPAFLFNLLERLTSTVCQFVIKQIESGADAIMLFDTWGEVLSPLTYRKLSLPYVKQIIENTRNFKIPIILYTRSSKKLFKVLLESGADVIGIDSSIDIGTARKLSKEQVAIQGNLDPSVLYKSKSHIHSNVRKILKGFGGGTGHIFNLSQGVPKDVPVSNVKELIKFVKQESVVYHGNQT